MFFFFKFKIRENIWQREVDKSVTCMTPTKIPGAEQGKESSNIYFSMGGMKYNSKNF